jgi:hypothetical protein
MKHLEGKLIIFLYDGGLIMLGPWGSMPFGIVPIIDLNFAWKMLLMNLQSLIIDIFCNKLHYFISDILSIKMS